MSSPMAMIRIHDRLITISSIASPEHGSMHYFLGRRDFPGRRVRYRASEATRRECYRGGAERCTLLFDYRFDHQELLSDLMIKSYRRASEGPLKATESCDRTIVFSH